MKKIIDRCEKAIEKLNIRTFSMIFLAVMLVSIVPIVWIGFYNYPSADDYSMGAACRDAWVSSHSLFKVLWQGVLMAWDDYWNWMGYYVSVFFLSIPYCVFGEKWYGLSTLVLVGLLASSTAYLIRALFVKAMKADKHSTRAVASLLIFLLVNCIVGRTEAFFWYCGAFNYIGLHSMEMFLFGAMISAVYDEKKGKRIYDLIIASLMGILVGGANQMTGLNASIIIVVFWVLMTVYKKWNGHKLLLIPSSITFVAFMLNCFAPGNRVRGATTGGFGPVKAILISLYTIFDTVMDDWTIWVVPAVMLLMIPFLWRSVKNTKFTFPCPVIVIIFAYGLSAAMVTPPIFAVGNIEAGRLMALIQIMFITLSVLGEWYLIGWVRKHIKIDAIAASDEQDHSRLYRNLYILFMCMVLLFGSAMCIKVDSHYYTSTSAATDLINGSAKAYGDAANIRSQLLNGPGEDIVLEPFPARPRLLYFSDITSSMEHWENGAIARYYHKNSVVLSQDY